MDRREWLKTTSALGAGLWLSHHNWNSIMAENEIRRSDFGNDFKWGVATAAYQIEGAHNAEGKGISIWDTFTRRKGKIKNNDNGDIACDFFHRFKEDVQLMKSLGIPEFRFSLSWTRLFPDGTGKRNEAGFDFYHRVIDELLANDIQPWITLYHWDLPQALEEKGGWTNREMLQWFSEYVDAATRAFGDRVKNWMVLNEPMAFTGLGYMLGMHAPGRKGLKNFFSAVYQAALCQGEGGRIVRRNVQNSNVGTTFSASWAEPWRNLAKDERAASRFDALWNRLFIEPALLGKFPVEGFPLLHKLDKHYKPGDEKIMQFDFDFIGLQNYTREVIRRWIFPPVLWAKIIPPAKRTDAPLTEMGWEVYPEGIYHLLKKFSAYPNAPAIYVTENGAAFPDQIQNERIHDEKRTQFIQDYLAQVLRAKQEGVNVKGYFIWTLMDNFEWAEAYHPRFGLVHVDFATQQRRVKDSGYWFRDFLKA